MQAGAQRTDAAGIQWPHVENVDALHLSKNLETLKTRGMLGISGNGTGLRTGSKKVGLGLDLCETIFSLAIDALVSR